MLAPGCGTPWRETGKNPEDSWRGNGPNSALCLRSKPRPLAEAPAVTEEQVFLAVLDLPDSVARSAYLDKACAENPELRCQVEALLGAHFRSGEFLDVPAVEQVSP